ncbi:hypothetical protein [Sphingomonas sp.]|nr:hypothetical protein [Sphingomonas sp.]
MIRFNRQRAYAGARAAATALLSIGVMFALFIMAIATVAGERRR